MEWMDGLGPFLKLIAVIIAVLLAMLVARLVFRKQASVKDET
jgi:hypothetical protein